MGFTHELTGFLTNSREKNRVKREAPYWNETRIELFETLDQHQVQLISANAL